MNNCSEEGIHKMQTFSSNLLIAAQRYPTYLNGARVSILKIYVKFCFDSRILILECQEYPGSPEYRVRLVPRVEMASKERKAASESGDHKALWEFQGTLDHGALKDPKERRGRKEKSVRWEQKEIRVSLETLAHGAL